MESFSNLAYFLSMNIFFKSYAPKTKNEFYIISEKLERLTTSVFVKILQSEILGRFPYVYVPKDWLSIWPPCSYVICRLQQHATTSECLEINLHFREHHFSWRCASTWCQDANNLEFLLHRAWPHGGFFLCDHEGNEGGRGSWNKRSN